MRLRTETCELYEDEQTLFPAILFDEIVGLKYWRQLKIFKIHFEEVPS